MRKRLTEAERLVDAEMLAMLEWASKHPKGWHKVGDRSKAAALLVKRGVIEYWPETNLYRLKSG